MIWEGVMGTVWVDARGGRPGVNRNAECRIRLTCCDPIFWIALKAVPGRANGPGCTKRAVLRLQLFKSRLSLPTVLAEQRRRPKPSSTF